MMEHPIYHINFNTKRISFKKISSNYLDHLQLRDLYRWIGKIMSSEEGIVYRMPMEGVEKVHPSIRLINDYKLIIPPVPRFIIFGRITETEGLILEDNNTEIIYFPDRLGNIVSLTDYIGEGKSGIVFSGVLREDLEKIKSEEKFAVKLYKLEILKELNQIQRIKREFEVGFQLTHPNIMKTFFLSQTNIDGIERYFLIMEYLDGLTFY